MYTLFAASLTTVRRMYVGLCSARRMLGENYPITLELSSMPTSTFVRDQITLQQLQCHRYL